LSAVATARSPEERAATGKAARSAAPRSAHAEWEPGTDRTNPLETLAAQDATRVEQLVPVRYGRMLASPFPFFRGGAAIMAADLATLPSSGLDVQLCGDAHLSNFGVFRAPDRQIVFDINDFDETHPGPFEWDLKRLAASFSIAGRELGFARRSRRAVVRSAVGEYRDAMRRFAGMRDVDVWYSRLEMEKLVERWGDTVTAKQRRRFERNLEKAKNKDSLRALDKLTERDEGALRFASRPPLLVPIEELAGDEGAEKAEEIAREVLTSYRRTLPPECRQLVNGYSYAHAAHKVVGVGSVGNRAWVALLLGRDADDPLFLQFKEAQASVLEPYTRRSRYSQHGRRVVEGQRLTQAAGDPLLGWLTVHGLDGVERDFYVRQLWDGKGSAEVELMGPKDMSAYARLCGWTLARAHARTGDRFAISAYVGASDRLDRALADFAEEYADQNERDHAEVAAAAKAGRVTAIPDV
jgi:uncharacterized protein (DUF2252 family)